MGCGSLQENSEHTARATSAGWSTATLRSGYPMAHRCGTQIPFRNTGVFRRKDGEWKVVHGHSSLGVRNEEMFGEDVGAFF